MLIWSLPAQTINLWSRPVAQVIPGPEELAAPHTTLWLSPPGHVSGRSQTCSHPALMGGFYAPVFCWCNIRVMISDVKIIQLCWWVSPKGSYPSMASTTGEPRPINPTTCCYLFSLIDNWNRFLLLVIFIPDVGRRNQAQSSHIKPMFVVYMGGCYWAHLSPHRLDCLCHGHGYFGRAACHAQFPGSETPRAGRDMAGCYYNIVHCVCHYIYIHIYPAAPLSENVQSFRNFHLKTSVALHLPCVLRSGMWSGGFCRIWLYDFWWFAGVWHFCCRWFADNSWRVGISIFENTPAFHAEALYAATFESHGPWVLYEYLGVSVRWGVLIIFDIVLHESFRCICLDCSLGPWDCSFHAFIEF